ncbi:UNVERIFIED_CONTAM: Serine carboxypeptidase II-3 [Sesamum radiatum]|uniref:Carboxypeptidase n=1 Tax=Sesamum radiatum TaxID=300843 RepID=A0AAW2RWF7_SESRA
MKRAIIVFLSVLCLLASVQCYGGKKRDPLGELIKGQRTKRSASFRAQDASTEYSPVYIAPQNGLKEADEITDLPGQPQVSFSQYSGYVTVDPVAGRALFYWFTESEDSPNKPLVLWLNGGPGCSSIGSGAMTELGPFRVNPDGKTLWYNKNGWNTVANILFLESPAGVGFSYSNTSSDYVTGDTRTAADSYTFLLNWLERFPEYKTRDFYITGESYAGHYIGNAYIDYEDEMSGIYDYFWTHALMSDEHHDAILNNCNFSSMASVSEKCQETMDDADADRGMYSSTTYMHPYALSSFDPCSDHYVFDYLNTPEVQKALHANVTGIPGPWDTCNDFIFFEWDEAPETVLPVIKDLMASGISVWIYRWKSASDNNQVGGYAVEYQNVTFVTIRGAGHFVPSYQPERALTFFSSFLEGKLPPGQN